MRTIAKRIFFILMVSAFITGITAISLLQCAWADVRTERPVYQPNEAIAVNFSDLPGNAQDWITIVETSKADNQYGQYFYTKGLKSGQMNFGGLPAGAYEVRVYYNWPAGGYQIQQRYPFVVQPTAGGGIVWTQKPVYAPQEQIIVEFSRLPGNPQDWITIVEAAKADNQYGQYFYTNGKHSGMMSFHGLQPGAYEVRVLYNWPAGGYNVQFRYPFAVR
jgi:hypothetical protein